MLKRNKSCNNCQYSRIIPDSKVVDCLHLEVDFNVLDQYKRVPTIVPEHCGYYEPKIIKSCKNCEEIINHPAYSWRYWVEDVFEQLPVCSRRCQENLQDKLDQRTDNLKINYKKEEDDKNYPF